MSTFIHCNSGGGEMGKYEGTHMKLEGDLGIVVVFDNPEDHSAVIALQPGDVVYRDAEKEAS